MDLTGDGVVASACNLPEKLKMPLPVIPGNLGVYSACCPLPEANGHIYNVSSNYVPMTDLPSQTCYLNNLGLTAMPDFKLEPNGIGGKGYFYPMDGRVYDWRGIRTVLDQPAAVGNVDMDLVGSFDNSNYAGNYRTYSDIRNGQIGYYVDPSQSQPFEYPVYTLSSNVDKTIRKDPMDSVKPEYILTPISSTLYNVSKDQETRDTLAFREEIMSRQQNLYNRTSWTNRWITPKNPGEFIAPPKAEKAEKAEKAVGNQNKSDMMKKWSKGLIARSTAF